MKPTTVGSADMQQGRRCRWLVVAVVLALVATACSSGGSKEEATPADPGVTAQGTGEFQLLLSTGQVDETDADLAVVEGDALSAEEVAAILDRLPPFAGEEGDQVDFNRPAESLPPPRAGRTVDQPFGASGSDQPSRPAPGPLEVLRHQPDGAVAVAPSLSVTFNQAMVPVGTLDQLDAEDVPVEVSPAVEGRWRWLGTRTLRLEHTSDEIDRLPAATEYQVVVPAGTESATGQALAEDFRFTFSTPAPTVESVVPGGDVIDVQPVFLITFDQRVDAQAVLDTVTLRADGDERSIRLATDDEIAADEQARAAAEQALDDRWVAFRPAEPLPGDAAVEVQVGPGTPSAEGSRTTSEPQEHTTRTRAPFAVTGTECGYQGCRPGDPLVIVLNNPVDLDAFDPAQVTVEPDIGASVMPFDNRIEVRGGTRADTAYEVRVSGELRDTFGQSLGDEETLRFDVGDARPMLVPFPRSVITTDPFVDEPVVPIVSTGNETLDVTLYEVDAADIGSYVSYVRNRHYEDLRGLPDWPVIARRTVEIDEPAELNETVVDLDDVIGGGGHVVITVESNLDLDPDDETYWNNRPIVAWVQATSLGIDALADHDRLVAWATDLQTGEPLDGVEVRLGRDAGTTDGDGLTSIDLGSGDFLIAERGDDSAVLTADSSGRWQAYDPGGSTRWYAFDGRGLFRPGDELEVKGWVRRLELDGGARLQLVGADRTVDYTVRDAFGNELLTGESALTAQGGFELSGTLPDGAALGEAHIELRLGDQEEHGFHPFQIQEFRRPEFEVITAPVGAGPHLLTGPVLVEASGRYFAGGVLPDAPITWQVTTSATTYSPPNWPAFTFGVAPPPWLEGGFGDSFGRGGFSEMSGPDCCMPPRETESFTYDARTDAGGSHVLQIDFAGQKPDEPIFVTANASVEDVNRQAFGSTVDVLVHPARLYVGLRGERNFVRQGEPLVVEGVVTDIDGAAVPGRQMTITAARVVEELRGGELVETDVDAQECVVGSEAEAVDCELETPIGGRYRITAVVNDDDGGSSRTELTRWVAGAEAVPSRTVEAGIATLVPDAAEYVAGDTARVLVIAPFSDGRGLLTISRAGIEDTQVFELQDGSAVLDVDVTDALVPGADLRVDLAGSTPRIGDDGRAADGAPDRPAHAVGHLRLPVGAASRTLGVTAEPADGTLEPGESTTVDVAVTGPGGSAVEGAEVAVAVVDEALLSLTGYQVGDPIEALYQDIGSFLNAERSRDGILLAPPSVFGEEGTAPPTTTPDGGDEGFATTGSAAGGAGGGAVGDDSVEQDMDGAEAAAPDAARARRGSLAALETSPAIEVRSDFSAVAVFEPTVVTGSDGRASIDVDLPDNLTRYRVMAVAADGDRFGTGESVITASLPLQVRPSPPRFANFGDAFELPVVVHNGSDEPTTAAVVLEASNLTVTGPVGKLVEVPAGDRVEVRFPVAVERAGTIRYRVTAVAGDRSDSASGELPAYTPTTTEAFATYGVIDDGSVAQPLLTPEGVVQQFGGLEIDTSSTSLQALTDAVVYLADYEYQSADAYAARITALVSLRDVFAAFDAAGQPSPEELDATVRSDLERLAALQNDDGGFPTWQRGRPSDPFLTVQAAHAFVVAQAEGFSVNGDAKARALEYLRTIEDHFPALWPEDARLAASAYAVHVRNLDGDRDPGKATELYRSEPDMPLDALAWLWPVVDDAAIRGEISRTLANRVTETPSAATFTTGYDESAAALVLASDRRTDGIVLDALIAQDPRSDLIPKVVAGLIGNQRRGGHWSNVQENGSILLAMKRYFDAFEATTPDFLARVWIGDSYTAEHAHRGRSIDTVRTVVPMGELGGDPDLILQKAGAGRLYYRLGLRYAPSDLRLDPRDEGFVVVRTYEAIDEPSDVVRNDDGSWTIAPGAMVRVRLSMVADSARTNMALVDHLPAGLEALNPALAASPRPPAEQEGDDLEPATWYGFTWFDHQSFRDDRSEAYSAYLPAGTYDHTYVARATTPGTFIAPPAKAEEIYAPEVFGRSGTDRVTVG